MAPRPIIIDCDPGQDDALAILLALGSPDELEVLAITAVAGNVPLALTEKNARKIVALAGRTDVPVHAGCAQPMVRELVTAEFVHGATGLDGADLPEPTTPLAATHAVDAIIDILRTRPEGTVTICPIGPLTNIAMAMRKAPDIVPRIREIVLMGGAIGQGNITPSAEFNIYVDPHAAKVVFEVRRQAHHAWARRHPPGAGDGSAAGRDRGAGHAGQPRGRRPAPILQSL